MPIKVVKMVGKHVLMFLIWKVFRKLKKQSILHIVMFSKDRVNYKFDLLSH